MKAPSSKKIFTSKFFDKVGDGLFYVQRGFFVLPGWFQLFSGVAIVYALFQKKMLPLAASRIVSKVMFYPSMPLTAITRWGNYWTPIDDTLMLGCPPFGFAGHPKELYNMGVRGVINMCDEYSGPIDAYDSIGITQLRLPTPDHFESTLNQLKDAVSFIHAHCERGEKVLVHCKGGNGRSAAVALSWMINTHPDEDPAVLNKALLSKRKVRVALFKQKSIRQFSALRGLSNTDT